MSLQQTFRINTPAVVSEAFEDEIVIIHLESGATYRVGPEEIAHIIPHFINELTQEQLIVPACAADQPHPPSLPNMLTPEGRAVNAPFTPPALTKFTDMQDLLLLDPIHDVGSGGWPAKK
jgi:hypothetical protein